MRAPWKNLRSVVGGGMGGGAAVVRGELMLGGGLHSMWGALILGRGAWVCAQDEECVHEWWCWSGAASIGRQQHAHRGGGRHALRHSPGGTTC